MSTAASPGKGVVPMALRPGMVVQELGWDTDTDEDLRGAMMDDLDGEFVYEPLEAVDAVLLWWRAEDGDLSDGLVDALTDLGSDGVIWLLTPKVGRPGYVEPADLSEGAVVAGLALTNSAAVSQDWQAHKLVRPKAGRR